MKVALDGSQHHRADGFDAGFRQQGPQNVETRLDGFGRHQHLRNEQGTGAEFFADNVERRDQTILENDGYVGTGVNFGLNQFGDVFLFVIHHRVEDLGNRHHTNPLTGKSASN